MPSVRITPWETLEDLVELGKCFYLENGSFQTDNELLEQGCNLTDAYSRRGPLPHAVASTARLARAVVAERCLSADPTRDQATDDGDDDGDSAHGAGTAGATVRQMREPSLRGTTASHAIAALFATAVAAFVTGYLDNQQTGATKRTMFDLAERIGMPPSWVAQRHAIVHEGYMGLRELRRVAREGLDWLWRNYWRSLLEKRTDDAGDDDSEDEDGDDAEINHADDEGADKILAVHVAAWASQSSSQSSVLKRYGGSGDALLNATATAMVHAKINPDAKRHGAAIVNALLIEEAMLAPFHSMKEEKHLILKWNPLLRSLATQLKRPFISKLIHGLQARLLQPNEQQASSETQAKGSKKSKSSTNARKQLPEDTADAILAWMRHLCNSSTWARIIRAETTFDELSRPLLEHPGPYATVLAVTLVRSRLWTGSKRHTWEAKKARHGATRRGVVESLQDLVDGLTKDITCIPSNKDGTMQLEREEHMTKRQETGGSDIDMDDHEIPHPQD